MKSVLFEEMKSGNDNILYLKGFSDFMYVVCKDHLELAIDRFVDEYEDAPDLVDLEETNFTSWDPPAHCNECSQPGRFLVV